jgi:hypothetical protein
MSAYQFDEFERRMRRINRRHTKLSQGYVTAVTDDGLVVAKPQKRRSGATLRGLVLIATVILVFKGFLLAQLGVDAYNDRVDRLAAGNVVEKVGAWVMTADPVTVSISSHLSSLVR